MSPPQYVRTSLGKTSVRSQAQGPSSGGIGTLRAPWGDCPWGRMARKEPPAPTAPLPRVCGVPGGAGLGELSRAEPRGCHGRCRLDCAVQPPCFLGDDTETHGFWTPDSNSVDPRGGAPSLRSRGMLVC